MTISYSLSKSIFGKYLVASTEKGICAVFFFDGNSQAVEKELKALYKKADIVKKKMPAHAEVENYFEKKSTVKLDLQGTDFQKRVWNELRKVPKGRPTTYLELAKAVGKPKAYRAVGTAVGNNPVSFIVPCHRVIRSDGTLGGYRWGIPRKLRMLALEGVEI